MEPAVFFDGRSNRRRLVTLNFGERLDIVDAAIPDAAPLASWPYDGLRRMDGPENALRLACTTAPPLARLELRDLEAQANILRRCPALHGPGSMASVPAWRIAAASFAAAAAILAMIWFGMPLIADRLAAIIPLTWEQPLGDAIDPQLRSLLGPTCDSPAGTAALRKLVEQLQGAAQLQNPPAALVLRSRMRNAFAIPGGRIYLLSGLLGKAETPDELAGVLSHELGHVSHRDGLRNLIREGGTSFLVGFLFGDVAGAGAVLMAGRLVLSAAYSREVEEQADAFAVRIMHALGRPAAPMGALLERISGPERNGNSILSSHPLTPDRKAMLESAEQRRTGPPLLDETEWQALKRICAQ